ncbi:MAG TPA: S9 family peptidase [Pseudonocardiaceae bacterium]|nr:S9 family peptidase [Pseudonocardiaceae bacterium]
MSCGPDDLAALSLAGSPTLAPDGTTAVVAVQTVDPDRLGYRSRLWSFGSLGSSPLTADGPWSDTSPVYSPNGEHVAFLSSQDGRRLAYVLDPETGAARTLGVLDGQVSAIAWLDDERLVGVVEHAAAAEPGAPVVVEWLRYKRDGGPSFVEPTHELWLFGIAQAARRLAGLPGRLACLTSVRGMAVYAMEERHSDLPAPVTQVRSLDPDTGVDKLVWRCPAPVTALTATAVSGDLVAVSSAVPGHSAVPPRLWVLSGDGMARPAFPDADLECERSVLGDSRPLGRSALVRPVAGTDDVVFLASVGHDVALFTGDPMDRLPRRITPEGCSVTDFSAAHHGQAAACIESPTRPIELHRIAIDTRTPERISDLNGDWVLTAAPVAPEAITVTGHDGTDVHGLLFRAHQATGPLVVRVHGGPHLAWGTVFDLETQALVSAGYRVLLPNPRGSAGRGGEFRALTVGDWGGGDHTDLMAFVDWATATGVADPQRLYLAGGSYGGFLTNWTLTRTRRFRAAVSERSISNFLSKLGTSDNGFTVNRFELGGADVFDDGAAALLDFSPLRHAAAITTPLLLIHGEDDYRCPIEQSEQLFVALRRLGVPARFARFPGEGHTLATSGRPDHRITRLTMIIGWLAEYDGARPVQRASRSASHASDSG